VRDGQMPEPLHMKTGLLEAFGEQLRMPLFQAPAMPGPPRYRQLCPPPCCYRPP
jgi:hypothetical protein